jgi:hypothetical protein
MINQPVFTLTDIQRLSEEALARLLETAATAQFVDPSLPIPEPYLGKGEIKLVIIGQDPTVQRAHSRKHIRTVLNLDRQRGLWAYLNRLCQDLGLSLAENVYATNACKNFFTEPPTTIKQKYNVDVLTASAPIWLPVLRQELATFTNAAIISLGEPVLSMLIRAGCPQAIRSYWGYHPDWKQGKVRPMEVVLTEQSTIGRSFHPFIHQPTYLSPRAAFYRHTWGTYIDFIRAYHRQRIDS